MQQVLSDRDIEILEISLKVLHGDTLATLLFIIAMKLATKYKKSIEITLNKQEEVNILKCHHRQILQMI